MSTPNFMPTASDGDKRLFSNVARLEIKISDTRITRVLGGTAFYVTDGTPNFWLFTNRHCLDMQYGDLQGKGFGIIELNVFFPAAQEHLSPCSFVCDFKSAVFKYCEVADLACFSFEILKSEAKQSAVKTFNMNLVVEENFYNSVRAGSQVLFLGYPGKLWDQTNQLPILRTATISSIPSVNYASSGQGPEPRVLVNGMSLGGSSGSPVFIQTKEGLKVLGMMGGHYPNIDLKGSWESDVSAEVVSGTVGGSHSGLSYFIKSHLMHGYKTWPEKQFNT